MKFPTSPIALVLMACLLSVSVSAQKHIEQRDPEALFDEGLVLFQNHEYGAAQAAFSHYMASSSDDKSQRYVDASYYEAVSALYLGKADAASKVVSFVNDNPSSLWAGHANFLYANTLFASKKYKDALSIYSTTDVSLLTTTEAQQLQFNTAYAYFQLDEFDRAAPLFRGLMLNEGRYQDDARYYYAHIQYSNEKDDEALENFSKLVGHPEYGKVVPAYIMQINYSKGDYNSVIDNNASMMQRVEKKRKGEMMLMVGDAYFNQKDYGKALEYYQQYIHNLSGKGVSREAYYHIGVSKFMTNDYKAAISDLQKVAGGHDAVGQYGSYYLAQCYAKTDEPKYARTAFYTAYAAGFDEQLGEEALFDYARLSLIPGVDPFNEAVGLLDDFVANHPQSARKDEAEELSVYLLLNAKENDEALDRLETMRMKSDELQTVYDELLYSTGVATYEKGDYAKSQTYFSKILNGKGLTNKAEACFWMGESAYQLGDYAVALRYLRQLQNMNGAAGTDEYALANYDLGYIYYQKPDYEEAVRYFRAFLQSVEDQSLKTDTYIRLGDCFFMERNYTQAVNYYDLATRVGKQNADYALYQQGLCYGAQGNVNQKVDVLNQMLTSYPSSKYYDQALFEIGNTYLVHGDKRSALSAFSRLVKERPRSSYARQALMKTGMIYYNNNQYDMAMQNLQAVVENHPGTDESREALGIIRSICMERNKLDEYFNYANSHGGQVKVSQQDSLAFATAENFYLDGRYQQANAALDYYFDNFKQGAYSLKAHQYALECAEKVGTLDEVLAHLDYILGQPDNDYTDNALLKIARIEYERGDYAKAGGYYARLANVTEEPLTRLEALEGSMKSYFFLDNYDKALEMGLDLLKSKDLTDEQVNQINHIVGKSYFKKGNYIAAVERLDKSSRADKSVYGAESAYYSIVASIYLNKYDEAENKVFDMSDAFGAYDFWVAKSFVALAEVYVAKENYFQAKETLRSVIDNYKGDDLRSEARKKLAEVERIENEN